MASLFKKTFAVVLALAMVFTCLTANAANEAPSISASTSYVDYYDEGTTVSLRVSTDNFDVIYGSDFTITIPAGYKFLSITEVDSDDKNDDKWVKGINFVVNGNTIRFLDVRTHEGFDFTLNLTKTDGAAALSDVKIAANMFVDANEAKYSSVVLNDGVISVTNTPVADGENGTIVDKEGYFIPYGSVVDAETGEYAKKNDDGTFNAGSTVSYFKLPTAEVGVSTFAVSKVEKYNDEYPNTIQFGSYAIDTDSKNLGTIVIMGDYKKFRDDKADEYADDQAFNDYIMNLCEEHLNGDKADKKLKIFYGKDSEYVRIGRVKRTTYTWKGKVGDSQHRQYALRVVSIVKGTRYSAIGYSEVDGNYTYSANVQSKLYE